MCRFKSGIILKNRCYVPDIDRHSDMLDELKIEDTYENEVRKFIRAELVPVDNEWWTDPADWKFVVDQDVTPEWFLEDRERYEKEFRGVVSAWWNEHVLVDKKIDELSNGSYILKRCEVKRLLNDVKIMVFDSSQVGKMLDSSQVGEMWGSSQVGEMLDSSQVGEMWGSSQVGEMFGSSQVGKMFGSSQVGKMWDSSQVGEMWGDSIARNYSTGKILISSESRLEIVVFENKEV